MQLAPASDTWDLSSLLVNGSPVSQATVIAVLEVLYSNMWALGFETQPRKAQYSLERLLDMLLFADAVGCSKQALSQLAGLIARSQLEVRLLPDSNAGAGSDSAAAAAADTEAGSAPAGSKLVQLELQGVHKYKDCENGTKKMLVRSYGAYTTAVHLLTALEARQLPQQAAQQLELLLFVGFKLDLQQLLQPALRFLRANSTREFLLRAEIESIFSQHVLAAAGGSSSVALLSRSCIQQPLGMGFGIGSVFNSITYDSADALAHMQRSLHWHLAA
jgi:hypothetical protein